MDIVIRDAIVADALALGHVHVEAWRRGYRGVMPDAFLASLRPFARGARWRERLQRVESDKKVLVAIRDDALVGFVGIGPARDEAGVRGEIYMINVLPSAWGTGVAITLLDHALHALSGLGHREAILWVLRQNARASSKRVTGATRLKRTGSRSRSTRFDTCARAQSTELARSRSVDRNRFATTLRAVVFNHA